MFNEQPCASGDTGGREAAVADNATPLLSVYTVGQRQAKEGGTFISRPVQGYSGRCRCISGGTGAIYTSNPVRAKIVKDPEKYLWNGHRSYMGRETLPWLTTEWVLSQFGRRLKRARTRYAEFVQYGIKDGHRHEFHKGTSGGRILGDDTFVDRVYRETDRLKRKPYHLTI